MRSSLIVGGFLVLLIIASLLIIGGVEPIIVWIVLFLLVTGLAAAHARGGSARLGVRWNYPSGKLTRKLTKSEVLVFVLILAITMGLFWIMVKFGLD